MLNDKAAIHQLKGADGKSPSKQDIAGAVERWMQVNRSLISELPSGAVVAFMSSESETCPGEDWKLFDAAKGRFLVGAGHDSDDGLTFKALGDKGGEERVVLGIPELPRHAHRVSDPGHYHQNKTATLPHGNGIAYTGFGTSSSGQPTHKARTNISIEKSGNGRSHNNMPPYIALYFCLKKDS